MVKKNIICSQCKCILMTVTFENEASDEKWQNIRENARHSDHPEVESELQDIN